MKWIAMLAVGLLASSAAVAQPVPPMAMGHGDFWRGAPDGPRERIAFLQERITRGREDRSLAPREADSAQQELDNLRRWIHRAHLETGGPLRPDQRARIEQTEDNISRQLWRMDHDRR